MRHQEQFVSKGGSNREKGQGVQQPAGKAKGGTKAAGKGEKGMGKKGMGKGRPTGKAVLPSSWW